MKNTYIKLYALILISFVSVSCVNDDETFGINENKALATTTVSNLTIAEGKTGYIPFTISSPITTTAKFRIDVVSGTAEEDVEYTAGTGDIVGENGISGEGFEMIVPAYAESFEIPVSTILDLDQTEGNETITLKISATGNRTILTPQDYIVEVTIEDFEYCLWTLSMSDDYGDGWGGGSISLEVNGDTTVYQNEDLVDDAPYVVETQVIEVPVLLGSAYSFTYNAGAGNGGAPDWESENTYTLTSPDGTVFSDGPTPTDGLITSGTNLCN